jgi:hypothetical protein
MFDIRKYKPHNKFDTRFTAATCLDTKYVFKWNLSNAFF